jgi:hypothetical protein
MNELVITTDPVADGWQQVASDNAANPIRGALCKCTDGRWLRGKEGADITGSQWIAMATREAFVKWVDNRPAEYLWREPGRHLPEREELGDTDEAEWAEGFGGAKKDPWVHTRFVYLIDPNTAEWLTYSTSSFGGRSAIVDLADQIATIRMANPNAVLMVELGDAPMPIKKLNITKRRPCFRVVGWRKVNEPALSKPAPEPSASELLNDSINF